MPTLQQVIDRLQRAALFDYFRTLTPAELRNLPQTLTVAGVDYSVATNIMGMQFLPDVDSARITVSPAQGQPYAFTSLEAILNPAGVRSALSQDAQAVASALAAALPNPTKLGQICQYYSEAVEYFNRIVPKPPQQNQQIPPHYVLERLNASWYEKRYFAQLKDDGVLQQQLIATIGNQRYMISAINSRLLFTGFRYAFQEMPDVSVGAMTSTAQSKGIDEVVFDDVGVQSVSRQFMAVYGQILDYVSETRTPIYKRPDFVAAGVIAAVAGAALLIGQMCSGGVPPVPRAVPAPTPGISANAY